MAKEIAVPAEEVFGINAGKVWAALRNGPLPLWEIASKAKLNENEVLGGLGWLSREGKIRLIQKEKGFLFGLTE